MSIITKTSGEFLSDGTRTYRLPIYCEEYSLFDLVNIAQQWHCGQSDGSYAWQSRNTPDATRDELLALSLTCRDVIKDGEDNCQIQAASIWESYIDSLLDEIDEE